MYLKTVTTVDCQLPDRDRQGVWLINQAELSELSNLSQEGQGLGTVHGLSGEVATGCSCCKKGLLRQETDRH